MITSIDGSPNLEPNDPIVDESLRFGIYERVGYLLRVAKDFPQSFRTCEPDLPDFSYPDYARAWGRSIMYQQPRRVIGILLPKSTTLLRQMHTVGSFTRQIGSRLEPQLSPRIESTLLTWLYDPNQYYTSVHLCETREFEKDPEGELGEMVNFSYSVTIASGFNTFIRSNFRDGKLQREAQSGYARSIPVEKQAEILAAVGVKFR